MHQATAAASATAAAAPSLSISKTIIRLLSDRPFQWKAFLLYKQLHSHGFRSPSSFSFLPSLIKACSSSSHYLRFGLQLHCFLIKTGRASDLVITNSLISMYSKHSDVPSACLLFDVTPLRDSVTWNSMVNCFIGNGYMLESLQMFRRMHSVGFSLKPELTAAVLSVCGRAGILGLGKAIHASYIVSKEAGSCVPLLTSLVDMYARCRDLDSALKVFGGISERNVVSWTAMITGCVLNRRYEMAIELFQVMWTEGIKPTRATLVSVLQAGGELGALLHVKELHGYALRHGFESEPQVTGALIDIYGRCCGACTLAKLIFERANAKDVVTWSSMMAISNQNKDYVGTLKVFQKMQYAGLKANSVTMLALIAACIGLTSTCLGQAVHVVALKLGLLSDVFVGNSLIDMYAKCGCPDSSICVFTEMQEKDLVSYSTMIASYGLQGRGDDALKLFKDMLDVGIQPDGISILAVLSACNHSGLVDKGKELFNNMRREYSDSLSLEHYACMIDILGRSGRVEDACTAFRNMPMDPSPKMLSSLVSACRAACQFEAAKKFALWLIDSEPENAANHALLSAICAESGDWLEAEEIRWQMRMKGVKKTSGSSTIQATTAQAI